MFLHRTAKDPANSTKTLRCESPKTKTFLDVLSAIDANGTTLLVSSAADKNLMLASRNISYVELVSGNDVNTYQVLKYDKLVFTKGAFEQLQARLS